jgi:hypothetical protein
MVISPEIFNNLVLKKDFSDAEAIDYLISVCKAYPNFMLPHILLLNYEPDFFHKEFWEKGEEMFLSSKNNLNAFMGKESVEERVILNKIKNNSLVNTVDQKVILLQYLSKDAPKFI